MSSNCTISEVDRADDSAIETLSDVIYNSFLATDPRFSTGSEIAKESLRYRLFGKHGNAGTMSLVRSGKLRAYLVRSDDEVCGAVILDSIGQQTKDLVNPEMWPASHLQLSRHLGYLDVLRRLQDNSVILQTICISPDFQRRGLGTQVLRSFAADLEKEGRTLVVRTESTPELCSFMHQATDSSASAVHLVYATRVSPDHENSEGSAQHGGDGEAQAVNPSAGLVAGAGHWEVFAFLPATLVDSGDTACEIEVCPGQG